MNKVKNFAVYACNYRRYPDGRIWNLHRKYDTMDKAVQAWTSLVSTPRRNRTNIYTILPVLDQHKKTILIKSEHRKELLSRSK